MWVGLGFRILRFRVLGFRVRVDSRHPNETQQNPSFLNHDLLQICFNAASHGPHSR